VAGFASGQNEIAGVLWVDIHIVSAIAGSQGKDLTELERVRAVVDLGE
jgi:hypothetical protein